MKFQPISSSAVRAGGEIRARMELTAGKILHQTDVEHLFAAPFHHRKTEPDVPGGFAGYGMLLDAIVKAAAHNIGGEELRTFKDEHIDDLISTQSADGAITFYEGKPGFWDPHDQSYMIQALVLDHRFFGKMESLEAALKLGEFLIRSKAPLTLGIETAFLMLGRESGRNEFIDYCRDEFKITESIDAYDHIVPVNGVAHVYTWIARVLAQLQYAQITGSNAPVLLEGAEELYRRVFSNYSSISGSCSGGFFWGEVWDNTQTGLGRWGETCVSAYLLRCTAKMFEFDADPKFGDLYERILFNAFFGAQSEDGMRQRYFIPFNEPGEWYEHETYCCPNNLRRMMFELPDAVYFKTPDGIALNLYTESELSLPGLKIRQTTAYPEAETVHLEISADEAFSLTLRIPGWCRNAKVSAGTDVFYPASGWFTLPVNTGKTEIELLFPMPVRLIRGTMAQTGRAALMRGPLVYAFEMKRNGLFSHETDLLAIDNSQPLDVQPDGIRVACVIQNQTYPRQDLLFTRFSNEHRTRTYFPVLSESGLENDELYKS